MADKVQERLYTADDLWNMPDDGKIYELHNGVLIEVAGSAEQQSALAMWIGLLLGNFIMAQKLGGRVLGADGTCVLAPFNTRIPDVAYVVSPRRKGGFHQGAPDLAIEVVSPSNDLQQMQERAGEYIQAGSRLVWIVFPEEKTIDVYRPDGSRLVLHKGDSLSGYAVLPGLALPVETVFSPFGEAL